MELNTIFVKPIEVIVSPTWREVSYDEAKEGKEDEMIIPGYKGKLVGVVTLHQAGIPHFVVLDESGRFQIIETYQATAVDYSSI